MTKGCSEKSNEALRLENEALRAQLARLTEVNRRATESLELGTVLQEVADGARLITDAQYAVVAYFDGSGRPREFVASGIGPEECKTFSGSSELLNFLDYLNEMHEPLRIPDFRNQSRFVTLESRTDPYLILLGESGVIIDDDDDGIFDIRARSSGIRIALEPGDYIVEATTYAGTATGDFTLTIIRPELAALHAFYNATDGENWRQSDNWLTDAPLSQWHGVTTDSDGRVTILELEHNHLSGKIPPEIGNLANLETLNLGGNDLSGELPAELGELEDLATLDLWGNALTGELPPELGNLANLKTLYLLANELTGGIPAELGNLTRLEVLHIGENQLTGAIPPELGCVDNCIKLGACQHLN